MTQEEKAAFVKEAGLDLQELLEFMKNLALRCGKTASAGRWLFSESQVQTKATVTDLVTEYDKKVEEMIISAISARYPNHGIFGEETGKSNSESPFCWFIDPIDGTVSYVHRAPTYAVSIGLHFKGKPLAGVVYTPEFDELFYAALGTGSYLNGVRIHVSDRDQLSRSVVATGFGCLRAGWKDNTLQFLNRIAPLTRDVRRYGAAAIDFCWVACGRTDAYWELNLQPYDYAAGEIILTEAGGCHTDLLGGDDTRMKGTLATNTVLHKVMLPFFKDYKASRK